MTLKFEEVYREVTGAPDQAVITVPDLATAVTLTAAVGGTWANGYGPAAATILAAASNTTNKRVVAICPCAPSAADEFQIALYEGSTLKAEIPYTVEVLTGSAPMIPLPKPVLIHLGNDIKANVACKGAVQRTIKVKLLCVEVPY